MQANIENDLTCFVGYLEPSSVKLGTAGSGGELRNCGIGLRERRFRDSRGNVYIYRDRAFYCPDAVHPILSSGELECGGAQIILNPNQDLKAHFAGNAKLPDDTSGLVVDGERCFSLSLE